MAVVEALEASLAELETTVTALEAAVVNLEARIELLEALVVLPEDYRTILRILGPTGVILPLVTDAEVNSYGSSFTTIGGETATFTWSEPPTSFDTGPSFQGTVPIVTFNGTNERATSGTDLIGGYPFSIGAWVSWASGTGDILSVGDSSVSNVYHGLEVLSSGAPRVINSNPSSDHLTGTPMVANTWHFVVGVWADATLRELFVDGVTQGTDTSSVTYGVTIDRTRLGAFSGNVNANWYSGIMAGGPCGPFVTQTELKPAEVASLYSHCVGLIGLP